MCRVRSADIAGVVRVSLVVVYDIVVGHDFLLVQHDWWIKERQHIRFRDPVTPQSLAVLVIQGLAGVVLSVLQAVEHLLFQVGGYLTAVLYSQFAHDLHQHGKR